MSCFIHSGTECELCVVGWGVCILARLHTFYTLHSNCRESVPGALLLCCYMRLKHAHLFIFLPTMNMTYPTRLKILNHSNVYGAYSS